MIVTPRINMFKSPLIVTKSMYRHCCHTVTCPSCYPQKNSTTICAVKMRRNMLSGYTVE